MSAFDPKPLPALSQSRRARLDKLVSKGQAFKGRILGVSYADSRCIITVEEVGAVVDPVDPKHTPDRRTWQVYGKTEPTVHLLRSVFTHVTAALDQVVYYEVDMESGNLVSLIPDNDPELEGK